MGLLHLTLHPDPACVVNQILIMVVQAIIMICATVPPFGHDLKMRIEKLALSSGGTCRFHNAQDYQVSKLNYLA